MGLARWFGGGLGLLLGGGPIGALIGFGLGALYEKLVDKEAVRGAPGSSSTTGQARAGMRSASGGDFLVSLLVLMAAVMKINCWVVKSTRSVKCSKMMPTYAKGSPGRAGSMQPTNPARMSIPLSMYNAISMLQS